MIKIMAKIKQYLIFLCTASNYDALAGTCNLIPNTTAWLNSDIIYVYIYKFLHITNYFTKWNSEIINMQYSI